MSQFGDRTTEEILSDTLIRGDAALASTVPVLRHLLENDDQSMFTDEIVARVRGMVRHIARQLLFALAEAAGESDPHAFTEHGFERLTGLLARDSALLGHAHTLALEYQLCERLYARIGLDPVLSPFLRTLFAASGTETSSAAMAVVAAQARFCQQQRRMELPLAELPEALFQSALSALHMPTVDLEQQIVTAAQSQLHAAFDERASRCGLLTRLVASQNQTGTPVLEATQAGVSLFISALAHATGQDRGSIVLAICDRQMTRFALSLRAAGLPAAAIETQFACFHPDAVAPYGFEMVDREQAALILSQSAVEIAD